MSTDEDKKKEFAEALLRNPEEPMKVAAQLERDPGKQLKMVMRWTKDPEFIALQETILQKRGGPLAFLPKKEEIARKLMKEHENCTNVAERRKILHDYSELMSFIEKPLPGQATVNVQTSGVMVLQSCSSDEEWEDKVAKQQAKLKNDASEGN